MNMQTVFYDRMTVRRDKFLVNKTNRRTDFQIYLYYDSTCFGQPFRPSSGVLSRTSTMVYFLQFWWPSASRSRKQTVIKTLRYIPLRMYGKKSWRWAEGPPETCRVVIPIKLEFSASVGFIHKELVRSIAFHHAWCINQSVAVFTDIFKVVGLDFLKKIIFNKFLLQFQSMLCQFTLLLAYPQYLFLKKNIKRPHDCSTHGISYP